MSRWHAVPALVLASLLSACATPTPRPAADRLESLWRAHAGALAPVTHWELRGRLAVHADQRGGQASLTWSRDPERQSIRLNGPLGRGVVRVTQDAHGARLTDAEQRVFEAANAEELLYRYTGWELPIANLDWWVRGLPVPGIADSRELDDAGRLRTLRQQGWEVVYQDYVRIEGRELPGYLTLTRAAADGAPAMQARLVIDRWAEVR